MGKLANVMRLATMVAVGGSSDCTREMAEFTYCRVWNISMFQSKKKINLGRAAPGVRPDLQESWDTVDCLFDGTGDRDHHLVDGHDAVIGGNQNAREIGGRKKRNRNG